MGLSSGAFARACFFCSLRLLGLTLLFGHRQDQLVVIIGDMIDPHRDLVPDEFAHFRPPHQRRHAIRLIRAAVEPKLEIIGVDRHRHLDGTDREVGVL